MIFVRVQPVQAEGDGEDREKELGGKVEDVNHLAAKGTRLRGSKRESAGIRGVSEQIS